MNRKIKVLLALAAAVAVPSIAQQSYREKYADLLELYSGNSEDSLKYKAAVFLVDNMDGHMSPEGKPMERYTQRVRTIGKTTGIHRLQTEWHDAAKTGPVRHLPDSAVVSSRYLADNIEAAFAAWEKAAWKDGITFWQFCRYILPYRVNDEYIGGEWRETLRTRYGALTEGVSDVRQAFAIVKDSVFKAVALSNDYCPYNLDPVTCHIVGRAECSQRCILLVAVLRALGIPAVIDGTPMWADYSNKGHAWVAMVASNGDTYTVYEDDKVARLFNPVDASRFIPRYRIKPEDNCPYTVKTEKTPVKVYRICYDRCNRVEPEDPMMLASPFIQDVSPQYGLKADIELDADNNDAVYLCSYLSGMDWAPVAKAKPENGRAVFRGVGEGAVCVAVTVGEGKRKTVSCPFIVGENGIEKEFIPSPTEKHTIHINRKYPLCSYITDTWGPMRGGTFEASMTEDFSDADTIAVIRTMPYGMTTLDVSPDSHGRKYRFLRYHAPANNRSSLSELQFYTTGEAGEQELLTGRYFTFGTDSAKLGNVFDGNPATAGKGLKTGYTIGLDLGENNAATISKIVFGPSTDLNFVEKGHLYELYCFDTEWRLLGRVYSKGDSLTFDNVPVGALLLLKDKSGGKEERIFEYTDGKQIWH